MRPTIPFRTSTCPKRNIAPRPHPSSSRITKSPQPAKTTLKRKRRPAHLDPWTPRKRTKPASTIPKPAPPTHYTCRICISEKPISQFVQWLPPSFQFKPASLPIPYACMSHLCRNPRRKNDPVCKQCIGSSLSAKLDTLGARKLSHGCLEPKCWTSWEFRHIMTFLPDSCLEKYNMGMLNVYLEAAPTFRCLNSSCGAIGLLDVTAIGYPHISCGTCGIRMCASCNIEWHIDLTCPEYLATNLHKKLSEPEKDTLKMIHKKDGKRCPNCYIVIEKDGGCNSMYCLGCKTYFYWTAAVPAVPRKGTMPPVPLGQVSHGVQGLCEMDGIGGGYGVPVAVAATA
ncbi:hypothetical protein K469DRAFT_706026 [Zopfia rhizophila CBS 207.26]|uniref:RBR-type E3 ubiquitin transferase n=1 Tax=Zopfia rhizophila CBS 207.26 TaxID=1314779 RepID=A0A6A6EQT7_9PEZI|nr:hypothetical protein K469DRAFT_706026 [Zopfia rhizophila CBS 207.26]